MTIIVDQSDQQAATAIKTLIIGDICKDTVAQRCLCIRDDGTVTAPSWGGGYYIPIDSLLLQMMESSTNFRILGCTKWLPTPRLGWKLWNEGPGEGWGQLHYDGGFPRKDIEIRFNPTPDADDPPFYVATTKDAFKFAVEPPGLILLHMLAHAAYRSWEKSAAPTEDEARDYEAVYRTNHNLPQRAGNGIFLDSAPIYDLGGSGCFIATATYGSANEPEVAALSQFRDRVLLRTRVGTEFFRRFYRQYYRFSRPIAAMIADDEELKAMARWAVTPTVRYVETALRFPNAPMDGLPEPWLGFLRTLRSDIENWTACVGLPESFAGLSPEAAAAELGTTLRYVLREEASRKAYLDRLVASGQLPILCKSAEFERCRAAFESLGYSDADIGHIFVQRAQEVVG